MNFIYDGTYDIEYEHINRTIIDGDFTKMLLIICKGNFGAINSEKLHAIFTTLSYLTCLHIHFNNNQYKWTSNLLSHLFLPINMNFCHYVSSNHERNGTIFP